MAKILKDVKEEDFDNLVEISELFKLLDPNQRGDIEDDTVFDAYIGLRTTAINDHTQFRLISRGLSSHQANWLAMALPNTTERRF